PRRTEQWSHKVEHPGSSDLMPAQFLHVALLPQQFDLPVHFTCEDRHVWIIVDLFRRIEGYSISLTASDAEDWLCSREDPGTLPFNESVGCG
ncbi:hypothetical protein M9458_014786, partial [Cirrhinus mrigala]